MFGLSKLAARILMAVAVLCLIALTLQVRSCQVAKQRAAQAKIERGQAGAARASGKDALNTQGQVHANDMTAADLDRTNSEEIRDASNNAAVSDDAHLAGLRAVCRREAYRNSERCRLLNANP